MKKGFTLIEMIGVMVILSLLMAFAMPSIINYIKKGGDTKDKVVIEMIYDAAKNYVSDNKNMFKKDENNTYCISLYTLASEGYIESPMTLSSSDDDITSESSTKTVKVTYDKKYKYELTDECTGMVNPTPILPKGFIPVYYNETNENWIVADPKTDDWYNYDEQRWANAVVLKQGVTKKVGDTVSVDGTEVLMMYVWVPKFEYNYKNLETELTEEEKLTPPIIDVNFIASEATTPSSSDYIIHPAFTFGTEKKSGIWVGKFELSHTTKSLGTGSSTSDYNAANLNCTTDMCTEAQYLRILPNVPSLRYNNVSNYWYAIKSIENTSLFGLSNIDIHMMKNSEWGAVAYLSQSKYGKYGNNNYEEDQKEVYINNSSGYYTGRSGGNVSGKTPINETYTTESLTDEYNTFGYYTYDGYLLNYGTNTKSTTKDINKGTGASTTGNIYGIYDMSGCSSEYVMGVYGNYHTIYSGNSVSSNSGFTGRIGNDNSSVEGTDLPNDKYYNKYKTSTSNTACGDDEVCHGHALSETSAWYEDNVEMIYEEEPWFVRGGSSVSLKIAGIFNFGNISGAGRKVSSTRVVVFVK